MPSTTKFYASLPAESAPVAETSQGWSREQKFLADALTPLEYAPISAWLGHVPFLFSVMQLVQPRRFVELGTHHGASFFAACQVVRSQNLKTECIAVDHWQGESQAGFYDESVFHGFQNHLDQNYKNFASFIRDDFNVAANQFEAGSVDLLHIDGFHSYDAVANDFTTWLPKLSKNGVILFHDVNEYQESFGVWRFWKEIEARYPGQTLFFGHSHGLGVLSLGSAKNSALTQLIQGWAKAGETSFIQHYFTGVAGIGEHARAKNVAEVKRAAAARQAEIEGMLPKFVVKTLIARIRGRRKSRA
jgi:hypothetical protein